MYAPLPLYPENLALPIRLFSSHSWKYGDHRAGLHDLLEGEWIKGVDFVDLSLPSGHPAAIESEKELIEVLADRISVTEALIIFTGMYADRRWIRTEVELAVAFRKPILAVCPNGQERNSSVATKYADEIVKWRGSSIREAVIRHLSVERREAFARKLAHRKLGQLYSGLIQGGRTTCPPNALGLLSTFRVDN